MFFPNPNIQKIMKTKESEGFFCVVYFSDTKKTVWYRKTWQPSKLAKTLNNWLWIKVYINKDDYFLNPKANNYLAIFDKNNPIQEFTFKPYMKKNL